jgi:hypothetical protein
MHAGKCVPLELVLLVRGHIFSGSSVAAYTRYQGVRDEHVFMAKESSDSEAAVPLYALQGPSTGGACSRNFREVGGSLGGRMCLSLLETLQYTLLSNDCSFSIVKYVSGWDACGT